MNFLLSLLIGFSSHALQIEKYNQKPKLVVVIVIDQFRADYLTRFQKKFIKPDSNGEVGGFNYLMSSGAYFPFAEYDVLQSMTCPGHAMIMSGSEPSMMGIPLNDWYDRKLKRMVYCAEDAEFEVSPKNLKTTTVGDELKNSGANSKVVTVALKDRAAVMLGGHRADLALWMNQKSFLWETSRFYASSLPKWALDYNSKLQKTKRINGADIREIKTNLSRDLGIEVVTEMAQEVLKSENLGAHENTDILAMSYSSHDFLGHMFGPNSKEMADLTLTEDRQISKLLTAIKRKLGSLKDVVLVFTADHGIAPTVDYAKSARIDSGKIDDLSLYKKVYERLDQKFGKPKKEWIIASKSFNFYLNPEALADRKVSSAAVEAEMKLALKEIPGVFDVATKSEIANRVIPFGILGEQLMRQYNPELSGDVILIPRPFYMEKDDNFVTHMTGYSYDRSVPLIISGPLIKSGVYANAARVIDMAPTLSFILGVLPPATTTGRVLNEIFITEKK